MIVLVSLRTDDKKTLFVESIDFFFWNMYFLVERRYCMKSFVQKENDFRESFVYFFEDNFCGKDYYTSRTRH